MCLEDLPIYCMNATLSKFLTLSSASQHGSTSALTMFWANSGGWRAHIPSVSVLIFKCHHEIWNPLQSGPLVQKWMETPLKQTRYLPACPFEWALTCPFFFFLRAQGMHLQYAVITKISLMGQDPLHVLSVAHWGNQGHGKPAFSMQIGAKKIAQGFWGYSWILQRAGSLKRACYNNGRHMYAYIFSGMSEFQLSYTCTGWNDVDSNTQQKQANTFWLECMDSKHQKIKYSWEPWSGMQAASSDGFPHTCTCRVTLAQLGER